MRLQGRQKRIVGIAAGIVAVAAVTLVLVLVVPGAPDNDTISNNGTAPNGIVLATIDGEAITEEHVSEMRLKLFHWWGRWVDIELALEHVITERLLFREAKQFGHIPTLQEAEHEALFRLAIAQVTRDDLQAQLDAGGITYEAYLEGFRRELAIERYLLDVIVVTEAEALEFYEELKETEEDELAPFEQLRSYIVSLLTHEKTHRLIQELKGKADIVYSQTDY